jgi:hypothetical protein
MRMQVNCLTCYCATTITLRRIKACTVYELVVPEGWLLSEDKLSGMPRSPLTFFVICPQCATRFPVPEPTVIVTDNHA